MDNLIMSKKSTKTSKSTLITLRVPNHIYNDLKSFVVPSRTMSDIILFSLAGYILELRKLQNGSHD